MSDRVLAFWVVDGSLPEQGRRPDYTVVFDTGKWTCTCPQFVYRKAWCKHIILCQNEERPGLGRLLAQAGF